MDTVLLQYGLAGVVIIALSAAVRLLWKQNSELQEKRLDDLKEISDKSNTTLNGLTDMIGQLKDALPKDKRGD